MIGMSYVAGAGLPPFGRHEGSTTLSLMSDAAQQALDDARLERGHIDAVICGYSGTQPHLMLANLFCENFGLQPKIALACQVGGATGLALIAQAEMMMHDSQIEHILILAGENRLSGQSRDASIQMLSQVGHARYEVPLGGTVPAYYALLANRYLHRHDLPEEDLAQLAVTMRTHATGHPGAHLRKAITVEDVMASKPIATPLKLLDCCPISDGAAAIIVSKTKPRKRPVKIRGTGQAHLHQHLCEAANLDEFGAALASQRAFKAAGMKRSEMDYAAIYDSFTVTLALLLEEIGFCEPGQAGMDAKSGRFSPNGELPLNTHGGLLSYGHCGVAGGMSHFVEAYRQLTGSAEGKSCKIQPTTAFVHADGGVMSAHVSVVLERTD